MAKKKTKETKPLGPKWVTREPEVYPETGQDIRRDGPALIDALAGLKGMNRELAERIASEWQEDCDEVEVAAHFGLDVLTAAEVIKVMEVTK